MPTLQEILNDAQFGDDVQFDFNGNKIPLKELRAMRGNFAKEQQEISQAKAAAEKSALEAANVLAQLLEEKGKTVTNKTPAAPEEWENDPIYKPVLNKFNPIFDAIKNLTASIEAQKKTVEQAQAIYAIDRMRAEFNRKADKDGKVKGKSFQELAAEAVNTKTVDSFGVPTLEPLIDRMTEPDRREEYAATRIKEERKKWDDEQRAAGSSKPGSSARFRTQKSDKPPIAKIEELTSDMVMNDPDVLAAMEGKVQ